MTGTSQSSTPNELTSSELVQRYLAEARVVKAFNSISDRHLLSLARPVGAADRSSLPIAGNDTAAKAEVTDLLDAFGFDAVDIGNLSESWRSQPNTPLYAVAYAGAPPSGLSPQEMYRWFLQTPGVAVSAKQIEELAATAVRGPAGVAV